MLDETMPVLAILNEGIVYDKVLSNCEEAKARQAKLIGVTNFIDENIKIFLMIWSQYLKSQISYRPL